MPAQVYLDHATTTPLLPEVAAAMRPFLEESFASAASLHQGGLVVRDALARARSQLARLINAGSAEEIIFTSNGTEATNLAVMGAAEASQARGKHIVTTTIEHPAVLRSIEALQDRGFSATRVGVDSQGRIDPERISQAVTNQTVLICVHHANYDIGTVQRLAELGRIAEERGIPLFVDATTSGGWIDIDVQRWGVGLLSLAAHRFYGPKGAGVLFRNRRVRLRPIIHGGIQEDGRRAGTENVAAIVGAGVAAERASGELNSRAAHTRERQKELWAGLRERISYIQLNGPDPGDERICNQLNISIEFVEGEGVMLMLDTRGIAVASGTACVSKSIKASPVLTAIGLSESLAQGALLLSPGRDTSSEQIGHALEIIAGVVTRLRSMSAGWDEFQRGAIKSAIQPN